MFNVSRNDVNFFQLAQSFTSNLCVYKIGSHSHFANFFQASVTGNGTSAFTHQLHTVIFFGIMACSNHNTTISFEMRSSEVNHFGTALTNVDNLSATVTQTFGQSIYKRTTTQTNVVTNNYCFSCKHCRKNATYSISKLFVYFRRVDTANVVGFEAFVCNHHNIYLLKFFKTVSLSTILFIKEKSCQWQDFYTRCLSRV